MESNYHSTIAMQRVEEEFYGGHSPLLTLCHANGKGKERLNRSMQGCLTDCVTSACEPEVRASVRMLKDRARPWSDGPISMSDLPS
jgi:hypothetical protein